MFKGLRGRTSTTARLSRSEPANFDRTKAQFYDSATGVKTQRRVRPRIPIVGSKTHRFSIVLRSDPPKPMSPVPNSASVEGSGTEEVMLVSPPAIVIEPLK